MVLLDTLFGDIPIPSYEHCSRMCRDGLESFICNGFIVYAIVLLVLFLLLWVINYFYNAFEQIVKKTLLPLFIFAWSLGFVVYDIGMYTGEPYSLVGNALMAVLHSFEMFILHSDASAIHEPFHNNWFYMMWFSIAHALAAFVTLAFVIKQFGYNIISAFKLYCRSSVFGSEKKYTYIFWGMNDASYYLAKSIQSHHEAGKETSYQIIFVRTKNDSETVSNKNELYRLLNFFSLKNKDYERLQELKCLNTNTYSDLTYLKFQDKDNILGKHLRLRSLCRIIRKKSMKELHIFSLSDDPQYNIRVISNLKKDKAICGFLESENEHKVKFYCHARYNSVNRIFEDINPLTKMDVRIVDSSHLSIECLKRVPLGKPSFQPIRFVDIDKTENFGTVSSTFTSLIVGFGETGRDALRYLYEFGAFVDSKSTPNETRRSKFRCHIVDKDLDSMKGPIISGSPQVFASRNPDDNSLLVKFHSINYNTNYFYNKLLKKLSKELNYVVIALGEDESSITLAIRILKYLRRSGRDFKKLKIFVRLYDSSMFPHMKTIADHFNRDECRLVLFGRIEEIYSYDLIIRDEFECRGKEYYDSYRRLNPEHDEDGTWEQRKKKIMNQVTLKKTKNLDPITGCHIFEERLNAEPKEPSLDDLQKLRRKETQDRANALHEETKMYLIREIIPSWFNEIIPKLFDNVQIEGNTIVKVNRMNSFENGKSIIEYPDLSEKQQILIQNLAKLEHLRWNASHEIMGYTLMPESVPNVSRGCDEPTATHNCLISWEQLDAETEKISYIQDYKLFDYGVVETTIDIMRRLIEKKKK